jgi:hypothetical protein
MRPLFLCTLVLLQAVMATAQYAPQAGISGSTAISKTSSLFKGWATGCRIQRGLQQIGNSSSGLASLGDSSLAIGAADNNVVSLGDSGVAVLTFATAVTNGPGADFAIFENGFGNSANAEEAFLELAFVEVSSDGINYFRFPASSLIQDTIQLSSVATPSYTNARQLNNLAGKYTAGWGTPFDLEELSGIPALNINAITHVRIVDAIGSIGSEASRDASGRKVNDPFPTPFPSSGFDLDALGVINALPAGIGNTELLKGVSVFPNPAKDQLHISLPDATCSVTLYDATGRRLQQATGSKTGLTFQLGTLPPGSYFVTVRNEAGSVCSTTVFSHN